MKELHNSGKSVILSCPKCGRDYDRRDVKITTEKRRGRNKEGKRERRPNMRATTDFRGNKLPIPINRYSNPSKIWKVFDFSGAIGQPVIYPGLAPESPKPRKNTEEHNMLKECLGLILDLNKQIGLFCEMSTALYLKFPDRRQELWKLIYECIQGVGLLQQMLRSTTDDRYKRSLTEWITITAYAMKTSPGAASKKFSGITPDGKKIHLSPKHIKHMIEEMSNFADNFIELIPKVRRNLGILGNIVKSDPELMEKSNKLSEQYDEENRLKIEKKMEGETWDDGNISSQSQHYGYQYRYYKIIHYDNELYAKQKAEYQKGLRKSKPDGRIECRVRADVRAEDLGL
jgi:hypothetical protein